MPKIYCSNPQCSKYQTPINLVKGDLVETNDADTFIGNKNCVEMINGEKCDSELEVFWPRMGLAPDLDVPSENNKPNNGRM